MTLFLDGPQTRMQSLTVWRVALILQWYREKQRPQISNLRILQKVLCLCPFVTALLCFVYAWVHCLHFYSCFVFVSMKSIDLTIWSAYYVRLWVGLPQNPITPRWHIDSYLQRQILVRKKIHNMCVRLCFWRLLSICHARHSSLRQG